MSSYVDSESSQLFIPDVCKPNALLMLVILTQLLATLFTLMHSQILLLDWEYLGLSSFFCHATTLSCAALICQARRLFDRLSTPQITLSCVTIITLVTVGFSVLCLHFSPYGMIENRVHFVLRNALVSGIIGSLLLRYLYLQHQWRMQKQAELSARLQALQARIRPHFLFNSMNTIASLVTIDPKKAEDAVLNLARLFRATLKHQDMLIPLEEELDLCRCYLNIEELRLDNRLKQEWNIDAELSAVRIPPLTLQPLLENAIYHGIQPLTEGGTIKLRAYLKDQNVTIMISNPFDANANKRHGNQIALDNIRSRLTGIFNHQAILKTSQQHDTFTVTLRFPAASQA